MILLVVLIYSVVVNIGLGFVTRLPGGAVGLKASPLIHRPLHI